MPKDIDIRALAKELYLTPDETNPKRRKYGSRGIAKEIKQCLNETVSYSTITLWIKDGQWEQDWDKYLKYGAWKSKKSDEADLEKQTDDARSEKLASYYENNAQFLEITDRILLEKLQKYEKHIDELDTSEVALVQRINATSKELAKEQEQDSKKYELSNKKLKITYNVVHLESDTRPSPKQIESKDDE